MVQRREVWLIMVAAPLVGIEMLVMVKSGLSASSITMLVAPGLEMFSARSSNRSSSSESSGVMATCEASGSVAQSLRTSGSMPSAPTRPMQ